MSQRISELDVVSRALIDGIADPVSGVRIADRFAELVPSATVTRLEGIGHYPQLESSDAVLQAVLSFERR